MFFRTGGQMVDSDPINTTNLTYWPVHSELRLLIIYFYIFIILLPPLLGGVKHTNSIINRTILLWLPKLSRMLPFIWFKLII
jgi:hypothetical protein